MELQSNTEGNGRENTEIFSYTNASVPAHSPKAGQVQNKSFSCKSTDNKETYSLKAERHLPRFSLKTRDALKKV